MSVEDRTMSAAENRRPVVGEEVEILEIGRAGEPVRRWHRTRVIAVGDQVAPGRWQIRVAGTSRFPDVPVGVASSDWRWPPP